MPTPKSLKIRRKILLFRGALLLAWAFVAFGWVWFTPSLDFKIGDWRVNFWMAAQGSLLFFLLITVLNAWVVNRWEAQIQVEEAKGTGSPP